MKWPIAPSTAPKMATTPSGRSTDFQNRTPTGTWGSRGGASREAAGILAVHALVLAHQPHEPTVEFLLVEADQVPELGVQLGHRLIGAGLLRGHRLQVVPLLAGHLAGLAADAGGGVDELRHDGEMAHPRRASPQRRGGAADLEVVPSHGRPPTPSRASRETPCTR